MAAFLFTIYLIACCFCITRIKFIRDSNLGGPMILGLFLIKIAAGLALGLVNHFLMHNATDYDVFNNLGIIEHHNLFSDPHLFFTDIFKSNYAETGEYFGSSHSYWNDLRTNIILKVLAFMNIFSRGNYYTNSLFFNFLFFFGHVAFYRIFIHIFPKAKLSVIIGCFLIPSMLYFSSGIHKDGIVFTVLAVFCYSLYVSLDCGFSRKRILFLVLSFITILLIRNFIAIVLLPCAFTWFISRRFQIQPYYSFALMLTLLISGVAVLHFTAKQYDPLKIVIAKQQSFFALSTASTQYQNDTLTPVIKSFLQGAPKALTHAYASPYPGEFNNPFVNMLSVEVVACWTAFFLFLLYPLKERDRKNEFLIFVAIFTFLVFLFIGYITTAVGTLIRYRSIYLPLIITPLLAQINWRLISGRKNK